MCSSDLAGTGVIEMDHVRFSYSPDAELIGDLSLRVEPGQTIAIVGPTETGKTTLVNLLMRFYEIDRHLLLLRFFPICFPSFFYLLRRESSDPFVSAFDKGIDQLLMAQFIFRNRGIGIFLGQPAHIV